MAGFTSYDGIIASCTTGKRLVAPFFKNTGTLILSNWYHLWPLNGQPAAGALYTGTALEHQRTTESSAGSLAHGGNKSPDFKHLTYMSAIDQVGLNGATLMLVDQVGYYPITPGAVVGAGNQQTFDQATTLPDRYVGAGECGLQAMLVSAGAPDATACNLTEFTYYDQDGNQKSCPITVAITPSAVQASTTQAARVVTGSATAANATDQGPFIPLAAGNTGIRYLKTCTFSAAQTLLAFVMVKPLAVISIPHTIHACGEKDLVTQLVSFERIYDGACLAFVAYYPVATACCLSGTVDFVWG